MKRVMLAVAVCACAFTSIAFTYASRSNDDRKFPSLLPDNANAAPARRWSDSIYNRIGLDSNGLSREAFFKACKGYEYLLEKGQLKKPELLTIGCPELASDIWQWRRSSAQQSLAAPS